ncbi:acyl-[acyl-carrier-protein] thioesterase [Treponema brennaborense]|uniref:Acyl-ACP thioesterase n=1 Tax=Treponema brennaborense (strain DSM 12168 / CIP 105900 / DD5/3) TaxID=906968 RepID=F4LNB1_TREBD|nr:acyl-ACP thioesterase domain-containing protein [Treponema brennaborense]AEE17869.1 acyl-ACP thioesterase [Treponema brennaborense DSM 12168]
MICFKQWHEDTFFYRETKLNFCQCDELHQLNLSELLLVTADSAIEDYHQRGFTYEYLNDHGVAILVSRVSFKIHSMPKSNDIITIKTWEEAPVGLQLARRYEITGVSGQSLVSGYSTWLVVNPELRRIMKPSQFTLRDEPTLKTEFCGLDCTKIAVPEDMQLLDERTIRYTDIDANGHMNNARYGAYIIDCLPAEYQQKTLTDFRINYSHEARKGDTLRLFGKAEESAHKLIVVGKTDGGTCFESELYFA